MIFFLAFLLQSMALQSQVPKEVPASNAGGANAGSLLTQFTTAIKPSSFTDAWSSSKTGWLGKAAKITDAAGLGKGISSLAGFIKPSLFKQGFNIESLVQAGKTATTMTDATGLLKNLESGVKPEAMTSGWASKRSSWLSALNLLK